MKVSLIVAPQGVYKYSELNSEEILAAIARHGVIKQGGDKLIKYLLDNKHFSPLDMINFVFEIQTSRAIGRQMLRHWSLHPQEVSQRYSSDVKFESFELRKEHPVNRQSSEEVFNPILENVHGEIEASYLIEGTLITIRNLYLNLLEAGVAKECARMILPECTSTTIAFNGTLRSWLSFLNVRCDEHAQKEIRDIAFKVGEILEKEMPNVFSQINWRKGMFM